MRLNPLIQQWLYDRFIFTEHMFKHTIHGNKYNTRFLTTFTQYKYTGGYPIGLDRSDNLLYMCVHIYINIKYCIRLSLINKDNFINVIKLHSLIKILQNNLFHRIQVFPASAATYISATRFRKNTCKNTIFHI